MVFFFHFHLNFDRTFCTQSGDPDQTSRSAASDPGRCCLPMSHKRTLGLYGLNLEIKRLVPLLKSLTF